MAIHLYKTSTQSTCNGAVDSQVKSNTRNNLIYGQHRCKGRNARGIISIKRKGLFHLINWHLRSHVCDKHICERFIWCLFGDLRMRILLFFFSYCYAIMTRDVTGFGKLVLNHLDLQWCNKYCLANGVILIFF